MDFLPEFDVPSERHPVAGLQERLEVQWERVRTVLCVPNSDGGLHNENNGKVLATIT